MADNAATRQALIRIGFTQDAAQAIVEDQGIDSLEEIALLKDDEITALCKIVRRPGGVDGDEGHTVSQKAEKNLKLGAYLIKH
jgi:ribosomal protein S13